MANKFKFLKTLVTKNWMLKLLALIAAAITFYGIRMATSEEITVDIPLLVEVKAGVAIQRRDATSALVTFRGSYDALRSLVPGNIKVVVRAEANNIDAPETIEISLRDVEGYSGVRPTVITPSDVTVSFDSEAVEEIEIDVPRIGSSAPKIGVAEIVGFEPNKVKVRGSMRKLREMLKNGTKLHSEPVDVEGRVESFTKMVRVLAPSEGSFVIDPPEIKVKVNIVTEKIVKNMTNVVIHAMVGQNSDYGILLEPSKVSLTLAGRAEVMNTLNGSSIIVFVDCTDLSQGATNEVPVNVHLSSAEGIDVTVTPPKVRAKFGSIKK